MGGSDYGGVRSKALIAAARQAESMRTAEKFGIGPVEPGIDFKAVMRHVRDVVAVIAPNHSVERLTALGVRVIMAEARFKNAGTLDRRRQRGPAGYFVLATVSSPLLPHISGLADVDYLTSETVFDLARRPTHLIVLGSGAIGIELAQAFRRLGSDVTVIEAGAVLGDEDPEMVAVVLRRLRSEGVTIVAHSRRSASNAAARPESGPCGNAGWAGHVRWQPSADRNGRPSQCRRA